MKLGLHKQKTGKNSNTWKLNSRMLDNLWVKGDQRRNKKYSWVQVRMKRQTIRTYRTRQGQKRQVKESSWDYELSSEKSNRCNFGILLRLYYCFLQAAFFDFMRGTVLSCYFLGSTFGVLGPFKVKLLTSLPFRG